jgi:heat shock protein HspQ
MPDFKFENGQQVRDKVTGFVGTIVVQSFYLNKCLRYGVQPKVSEKEPEKVPETIMFDEDQLELLDAPAVEMPRKKTGGPFDQPKLAR